MPRPFKSPPSEQLDWDARVAQMMSEAEQLPQGHERSEAIRQAREMTEAASMRQWLRPAKSKADAITHSIVDGKMIPRPATE